MGVGSSVPFISAGIIAPVPDVISDLGGKVDRPFLASGVPIELASEPEQLLPISDFLALIEAASRETGDEHFGVSLSERLKYEDLGPFGRLQAGAPTLRRAIETANGLIQYYSRASRCWLEIEGETVRWHYQLIGVRNFQEGRRIDCEGSLFLFRTLIRLAAGPNWQPSEFLLEQATPHQLRALQSRLGAPVRPVGNTYALVFPRDVLDLPMSFAKPLAERERQALFSDLISSRPEDSFVGSVKAIIRAQLCGGYPEISAVARSIGLSQRTFQRRLGKQALTYSDLVMEIRFELAQELLADPLRGLLDISLSLGYGDSASFSRAFKQWAGVTPSEFRRSLLLPAAAA